MMYMPYEGAGFLLGCDDQIILGIRKKKPEDLAKDATREIEYMGGKPELADGNDPAQTAWAELAEELGISILDADWKFRTRVIHIYQPFSKKWIWCHMIRINCKERELLDQAARELNTRDYWDNEYPFRSWTNREGPVRQSLDAIVTVSLADMVDYVAKFAAAPNSGNRMKDAKAFGQSHTLPSRDYVTGELGEFPLRGFNLVMWEQHYATIEQFFGTQ